MYTSNLLARSNLIMTQEENPFWDSEYVKYVIDYKILNYIHKRREIDKRICELPSVQKAIHNVERIRCCYAKNDPCYGYVKKLNKVVNRCINGECPEIMKCNSKYTVEEEMFWKTSDEDKRLYGNPEKLKIYYKVDMVSDEEMELYDTYPNNSEREFIVKNPIIPDLKKEIIKEMPYKIDPKTGKKLVVIGYEWKIFDNASYENEHLCEIWGFADEISEPKKVIKSKSKQLTRIEDDISLKNKNKINEKFNENSMQATINYKKILEDKLQSIIKIGNISVDSFKYAGNVLLIACNKAEKAYISQMLLKQEIDHGFDMFSQIQLISIEEYSEKMSNKTIWVSNTLLESSWIETDNILKKIVEDVYSFGKIIIPEREYFEYSCIAGNRWCCKNNYGVTHICLEKEDLMDIANLHYSETEPLNVTLYKETESYYIEETENGCFLGYVNKQFVKILSSLRDDDEIQEMPEYIEGLSLCKKNEELIIKGIGHMKFIEY